jgi:hypothetical protein
MFVTFYAFVSFLYALFWHVALRVQNTRHFGDRCSPKVVTCNRLFSYIYIYIYLFIYLFIYYLFIN